MRDNLKLLPLSISLILLICSIALAPSVITNFTASNAVDFVLLEWTSGTEAGVSNFQVERSLDGIEFLAIATVSPQGSNSDYTYEDHDLYKGATRTYYYRIKAQMDNGSSNFSSVETVTLSFSGIQQTWGSIKSLFR